MMDVGPLSGRLIDFERVRYLRFGPLDWYYEDGGSFIAVESYEQVQKLNEAYGQTPQGRG